MRWTFKASARAVIRVARALQKPRRGELQLGLRERVYSLADPFLLHSISQLDSATRAVPLLNQLTALPLTPAPLPRENRKQADNSETEPVCRDNPKSNGSFTFPARRTTEAGSPAGLPMSDSARCPA